MKICLVVVCLLLGSIETRWFETSMKMSNIGSNNGWVYLDKMTFAPGTVEYRIKTSVKGIPYGSSGKVVVQAVPQYMWEDQQMRKCQDIPRQPFLKHKISVASGSQDFTRENFKIQEETMYYFVLKDCLRELKAEYNNSNLSLNIKLHLLNNDRQVGQEEDHWYIVAVTFLCGVWLVYFYQKNSKDGLKNEYHKMVMFAGISAQISSLVWKTIGFLIYVYTGADYTFFHIIYLLMHSMSESLVIGLIVLIGFGWTINFKNGKDMDLYGPIMGCLAFLNAVMTILTKLQYSTHDRHHIFDNISGHVVIGFRLLILLIFVFGVFNTYKSSRSRVQDFIIKFGILGGVYISALPFIVFIGNNYVEARDRHEFVFVAIQGLKCLSNIGLSMMLNREKSEYNEVSYDKKSFMPEDSRYF